MRKSYILISIGLAVIIIAAGSIILVRKNSPQNNTSTLIQSSTLDTLPVKDGSSADTKHLAPTIIPPTNSWLSGMVLQTDPKPVYPMPLSFFAKESEFEIGLPTVAVTATTINGGHTAGMQISVAKAATFQMTRFDKISATLTYEDAEGSKLGSVTLAEGVPYVYYRALEAGTLTLNDIIPAQGANSTSKYLRYTKAGHDYVALIDNGSITATGGSNANVKLEKGSLVTFYALPDNGKDNLREFAGNEVASVTTTHKVSKEIATTTLEYNTANNKPTVYAPMGYAITSKPDVVIASYENIYGRMQAEAGNKLTTNAPIIPASSQLDLSQLTSDHKQRLIELLNDDVTTTKITAQDSYYAGKQLGRAANLLDIAMQLKQDDAVKKLQTIIKDELTKRLDSNYFYYDSKIKGIAATTSAFGSEDFNDHHFHYGNFIYAASILGRYDKPFLADYKDKMNLLVADIASYKPTDKFPVQRNYDAYAGHSWAAGLAPFADGNNQESSSEAMNAWNAVALWGELINNEELATTGKWMLANESSTARNVWRSPPIEIPGRSKYTSPITSLNFGGKLTYATFFSDEPNAKLGIQLISMNPFMTELSRDSEKISEVVDKSIANNNFNVPLGDYILMYLSLQEPERALDNAVKQQDEYIDDGSSRTYLNAFIFSQVNQD
ncbi:MAG: Endo,3(4)-beta-glucanase [Candidatus Saccharibacteria bacterium]|nr:Endo,3(4)-beta-glucanase [Candidatus Saccharibacteria bacterium]